MFSLQRYLLPTSDFLNYKYYWNTTSHKKVDCWSYEIEVLFSEQLWPTQMTWCLKEINLYLWSQWDLWWSLIILANGLFKGFNSGHLWLNLLKQLFVFIAFYFNHHRFIWSLYLFDNYRKYLCKFLKIPLGDLCWTTPDDRKHSPIT